MKENAIQITGGITINVDASAKNIILNYTWNPATCSCKNGKYLASIIDDSVIMCDKIIEEETKTVPTNFNEKKQPVKKNYTFYLPFY